MTRDTSIEAYNNIAEAKTLSATRLRVLEAVYVLRSCTSAEAIYTMDIGKAGTLTQSRARFTELRDMGCLRENGTRLCKITGNRAIVWEPTGKFPEAIEKVKGTSGKDKLLLIRKEICDARKFLSDRLIPMDMYDPSYPFMVRALESLDKALILF